MANFWENLTTPIKKAAQSVGNWWKKTAEEAERKRKEQEKAARKRAEQKPTLTSVGGLNDIFRGTLLEKPIKKISELPKETAKYFEPVPDKVRARDIVRETPESAKKVAKGIVKFAKDVLRATPRAAGQFTLSAMGEKEFVPGTGIAPKLEKFLFGEEPIHDIKTTGEETVKTFGGSQNTAARFGLPVGLVLGMLDLIPIMPGKAKIAEELGEELITKYGDDVARMIIKKGGKNLVEKALEEGGEKAVQKSGIAVKTIRELLYDLPANLMPAKGKATWTHGKLLWNTMRNQFGEANTLGKDITKNKGAVSWIIDTLEGGKKALAPLMEKYADQGMTTKQYKKLYAMFKSRDYGIEGYKKVMATLKGIEPAVIEKTIEPIKTATKEVAEKIIPKATEGIKVIRYGTPKTISTDALRGGTWYMTPESKTYDFSKIAGVGGDLKMEASVAIKKPLVIKDAILEDGSFSVINSGYEKYLPEKIAKAADEMYTAVRDAKNTGKADLAIMNGLYDAGISEDAARKAIGTSNKFDAAMDLIVSKGLKEKGYDSLILENVSKGKVIDRHIFKLAEQTAEQAKAVPQELEALAKEAGKYKNADEFVTAIWNKLNKEKTNVPGFPDGGIRDASSAVAKYLKQLDKGGYPTKGWFDSFQDFYTKVAGQAEKAMKTAGGTAEDLIKRRDALEKLRYANPGDERIAKAIAKLDDQIRAVAEGKIMKGIPSITPTEGGFLAKRADGTQQLFKTQDEAYKFLGLEKAEAVAKELPIFYHGTDFENIPKIKKGGFKVGGFLAHGYPQGVYFSTTKREAENYGKVIAVQTRLKLSDFLDVSKNKELNGLQGNRYLKKLNEIIRTEAEKMGVAIPDPTPNQARQYFNMIGEKIKDPLDISDIKTETLQKMGYKGFIAAEKGIGKEIVVFDPKHLKVLDNLPKTLTSKAEKALEEINAKGQPVIKAGKKKALANLRADQLKSPPPTPPRIPEEIPLADAPKPPAGSGLEAIDKMLGETSKPKKILEWLKQAPKKFTEAFSDRFAPMKRFEDEIAKMAGQPIDINSSPYVAARMYAGRMGTVEAELNDLQKIINPLRKERADFTRYVLAKRATERASRGFANPAGVTEQQALQAINELKTKVGDSVFRQFESAEQAIQTWADQAILQPAVKSGILSKEAYEAIAKNNKHWIPFQVLDYLPDVAKADTLRSGSEIFSVGKQGIIKGLQGTEKAIRDPFEAIIDRLSQSVSLVKRNEVAKKMIDLRNQFGQAKELIVSLAKDVAAPKGWGSLSVFVDGKVTKWAVPEELSWAMHQMNEAEAGLIGKFMRFTSGAFRKGATSLYIPFSLSNAFRDAQMAIMTSKYGFNAADWLRGFASGLKGVFGWESKLLDDFMRNSGGFGGFIQSARGISGAKKVLFEPSWWKKAKAVINPFNLISNFAEAIELAPRLGIYSKGLRKGATAFEAAFEARNATIDFARAGQEMRIINMWIPFVNARWQALLNTVRVFKERPIRSAAKVTALIVAPGVTTYLWNTINYPDLYDDIPQWAKDTYFTVIVGEELDKNGNRVPKVVQIPKGDVGQIFYNPIEYAMDYVRKGEPQNFAKLALEWMSQLAPIPFTRDGELSVEQVLSGGLPPAIRTPIELATNQSFFAGYPIVPRSMEKIAPTEQYDEKTPQLAVTIGRAMGISPMKLAYGVGGLLGGFGREAIDPAKILDLTVQRFYRTSGGAKRNEAWNVKYEAEVGYATARQQAMRAIEAGDNQTAFKIMDNWNQAAEKIVPEITPYLAQDDPLEAESIRKSVTFQSADMARLQRSVTEKALSKAEEEKKMGKGLTADELSKMRKGGQAQPVTMGQIIKTQASEQPDLKSMREALRR